MVTAFQAGSQAGEAVYRRDLGLKSRYATSLMRQARRLGVGDRRLLAALVDICCSDEALARGAVAVEISDATPLDVNPGEAEPDNRVMDVDEGLQDGEPGWAARFVSDGHHPEVAAVAALICAGSLLECGAVPDGVDSLLDGLGRTMTGSETQVVYNLRDARGGSRSEPGAEEGEGRLAGPGDDIPF